MSEVVPFVFNHEEQTTPIRAMKLGGRPWFVAADVCAVLALSQTSAALRPLKDTEKGSIPITTPGGPQRMSIINRNGLTRLVMRSDKPQALMFQDWIIEEVIPAILDTGKYESPLTAGGPAQPDLLEAINRVDERLGRIEGRLDEGRLNFSEEAERTALVNVAKYNNCECIFCNDTIVTTIYGKALGNYRVHHGNGNRNDNRPQNCMVPCLDCHDRLHKPKHPEHIEAYKAQAIVLAFQERVRQKAGRIKAPDPTATRHWDFRVATQADMGFPTMWRKP